MIAGRKDEIARNVTQVKAPFVRTITAQFSHNPDDEFVKSAYNASTEYVVGATSIITDDDISLVVIHNAGMRTLVGKSPD